MVGQAARRGVAIWATVRGKAAVPALLRLRIGARSGGRLLYGPSAGTSGLETE